MVYDINTPDEVKQAKAAFVRAKLRAIAETPEEVKQARVALVRDKVRAAVKAVSSRREPEAPADASAEAAAYRAAARPWSALDDCAPALDALAREEQEVAAASRSAFEAKKGKPAPAYAKVCYDRDVAILKQYGNQYKLTLHKSLRRPGLEYPQDRNRERAPRGTANGEKLSQSISRARSKVKAYALCNDWQFFATLTLDASKYDRCDLGKYVKDLGVFVNNCQRGRTTKIIRVIIPEQHRDGAWHLHALFGGLDMSDLVPYCHDDFSNGVVRSDGKIPDYIRHKLDAGDPVYRWPAYADRFGYCIFDPIGDPDKIANYVLKYFSKDMSRSVSECNAQLYYASKGLKTEVEVARGWLQGDFAPTFANEYVASAWYGPDDVDEALAMVRPVNFNDLTLAAHLPHYGALKDRGLRGYKDSPVDPLTGAPLTWGSFARLGDPGLVLEECDRLAADVAARGVDAAVDVIAEYLRSADLSDCRRHPRRIGLRADLLDVFKDRYMYWVLLVVIGSEQAEWVEAKFHGMLADMIGAK